MNQLTFIAPSWDGSDTRIGTDVHIGKNTRVAHSVTIYDYTDIGEGCEIYPGVIIGTPPLDFHFANETSWVKIGKNNIIREYTTISRATGKNKATIIGDKNLFMAYVHISHNCCIGNRTIIANSTQLAGHVIVGDRAIIGGMTGVHQFCRIGCLAMVGACSYLKKDIPPFFIGEGNPFRVRGVNIIGLKRNGFSQHQIAVLKKAYRILYRQNLSFSKAIETIEQSFSEDKNIQQLLHFLKTTKRGIEIK